MKVLVATEKPFAGVAVDGIRKVIEDAGYTLELLEKYTDKQQLLDAAATADAMIVRSDKVDAEILAAAKVLKLVVRAGAGYDNVDLAVAKARGVVVENTPGQNSNAVAELVFGMLVMAVRNMYAGTSGSELKGKTLGIHAFGQVGRNVARIANGFGLETSALDPYCPDDVSVHIPATPETKGSIGFDLISLMPHGGVLVNTARKEVIDETGLAKALEMRPDLKYVADIRPDNADELMARFPDQVFFTPKKMGAQTAEANINAGIAAARQTVAFLRDGDAKYRVN